MAKQTPDRILAASLRLFNQFGVSRVSACQVADEIGISPGNLAYHFPSKKFILYRLLEDLESQTFEALAGVDELDPAESASYLVRQFYLMWRYRFFFDSTGHSAEADSHILESRQRIRSLVQRKSIERLELAVASGVVRPVEPPSSPGIVAENLWAVWVYWLALSRLDSSSLLDARAAVLNCCLHHLALIRPQANGKYLRGVEAATREMVAKETATIETR